MIGTRWLGVWVRIALTTFIVAIVGCQAQDTDSTSRLEEEYLQRLIALQLTPGASRRVAGENAAWLCRPSGVEAAATRRLADCPDRAAGRPLIELRALTSEDWVVWRDLRLRALAEAPYAFGSTLEEWQDAEEKRWRARLELSGSHNVVARFADKPAGMATGAPFGDTYELISMWVAPEARGYGVADALIEEIVQWVRRQSASELRLRVKENNVNALRVYVRNGFIDAGPSREAGERMMMKHL